MKNWNCKNCRHWEEKRPTYGVCHVMSTENTDQCVPFEKSLIVAYPVCMHDGPAYQYETAPDFGCVHFKKVRPSGNSRTRKIDRLVKAGYSVIELGKRVKAIKGEEEIKGSLYQVHKQVFRY